MSASQLKALSNQATEQAAASIGFNSAGLAISVFVLVGLCLSLVLSFVNKKRSDAFLENDN